MTSLPPGISLSRIPVAATPLSMTSNFVDPESLATKILSTGIFILVLTAFVVTVRLFSNYRAIRGLGWDDGFCVIATVLLLIYVGISLDMRKNARHENDIPITWIKPSVVKKLYVQGIISGPMMFFAKSSLFLLYYRLFTTRKFIRHAIVFGIAFSFIIYFSNMTIVGVLCAPQVGHHWDWMTVVKCSRSPVFGFALGIQNLALDIYLVILPIPVILSLQLSAKKKIGVLAIFMVGLLALVASIVSLIYRTKLWQGTDPSWNGFICVIWTMIETGMTITCSSASALVTFWKVHIAIYVVPLYSCFCSRYGKSAFGFWFVSRASSITETCHPESDHSKSYPSLYNANNLELDEPHPTGYSSSTVRTESGGSAPTFEVEKGVIR
ncbi:hypothetical protein MMC29_008103 [Sticta canariensis]|nr:hypothetical protein [Sticta canariensis]